ncbi:N-acetylmuramidase family protein [Pseudomonas sp. EYE_354]|nr:N-acetylmuramidase family protein [Pseudomonas sp. EYE_354]
MLAHLTKPSYACARTTHIRFIEKDPILHKALMAKKWAAFAERYNGPAYARNL